ncbi:MAG TPA: protease inhibitor I42 family protein [Gammaproteobacteria bacterium]|nr:protease inhibitor I42 family protein [Gammaproteobacteria bacterium]
MRVLIGILVLCASVAMAAEKIESVTVYTEDKPAVMVQAKQPEFSIKLASNPTTGYSWYLRADDVNLVQPVKHVFQAPENKKLIGAPGYEIWTFRVKPSGFVVPTQTAIRFVYARPWEMNSQARQVVFQVTTS